MMYSVGQRLREARLDQGLDYDTLAARTKIQEKFLKAIEADDRKVFPSGFFYKSFVDQYARALSVDTREIDEELNRRLSEEAPLPLPGQGAAPIPIRSVSPLFETRRWPGLRSFASVAVLVVVLVGCSGFYAWWRKIEKRTAEQAPDKIQIAVVPTTSPKAAAPVRSSPAAEPDAAEPDAADVSLKAQPADALLPRAPQPADVSTSGEAQPENASASDAPQPEAKILLELMAREETWLSVSTDGLMIFKGTLSPHERKTVEGKEFAKLRVNNPAALDVKLNGKLLGPLGPPGQFLVVVFTRDKFHVLDSAKESD